MFKKIVEFFTGKSADAGLSYTDRMAQAAPYKIEPPQPQVDAKASTQTKCGCGRSQTGFCVGLHSLKPEEWAAHADNPAKVKKPRARKAPAEKPAPAAKKPRAKKTPAQ